MSGARVGLRLMQEPLQTQAQLQLPSLCGEGAESVFAQADRLLGHRRYQKAIRYVPNKRDPSSYHSVMDWLYVSVYPRHHEACMRFYRDDGPPLRKILTKAEVRFQDRVLCHVLAGALRAFEADEVARWGKLRRAAIIAARVDTFMADEGADS